MLIKLNKEFWKKLKEKNLTQQNVSNKTNITGKEHEAPWMLSICPILSAAPRTLHSVLTILSALASDSRGESNRELVSTKHTAHKNTLIQVVFEVI